ncbi:MAG: hydrogenase [Anaerovibrio sp.]|uniref:hydrogenase n=1 Tax=Anaerovibrio TaxID=82373 RepID=UPI000EBCF457|nr:MULTISPECIES: hydrogenase [Anaerovibrio]MBE6106629.1 hydrogenase [Anaerovibrio lipolyticus]MBO5589126.1 hydrogenase [Anaerovibrio sp.]MBO6245272.1 hydrogenase [Anaerovibrio sp.]HCP95755.1 hydrogenase [Anaerovibrio sp.]
MDYLVVFLVLVVFLQTRVTDLKRAVICLASQSVIIAIACFVIGFSHGNDIHAVMPGVLTLIVKVIFIPGAVYRLVKKLKNEREIVSASNVNYSTMAAALFLVMGYALVERLMPGSVGRDIVAASILMIMTGLSLMVLRKRAIIQICGLITLENGIYLLGLLMTEGLPLVVELGVFLDVLIAVVVLVILTSRMRLSFMTTDTSVMKKLKG